MHKYISYVFRILSDILILVLEMKGHILTRQSCIGSIGDLHWKNMRDQIYFISKIRILITNLAALSKTRLLFKQLIQ